MYRWNWYIINVVSIPRGLLFLFGRQTRYPANAPANGFNPSWASLPLRTMRTSQNVLHLCEVSIPRGLLFLFGPPYRALQETRHTPVSIPRGLLFLFGHNFDAISKFHVLVSIPRGLLFLFGRSDVLPSRSALVEFQSLAGFSSSSDATSCQLITPVVVLFQSLAGFSSSSD